MSLNKEKKSIKNNLNRHNNSQNNKKETMKKEIIKKNMKCCRKKS